MRGDGQGPESTGFERVVEGWRRRVREDVNARLDPDEALRVKWVDCFAWSAATLVTASASAVSHTTAHSTLPLTALEAMLAESLQLFPYRSGMRGCATSIVASRSFTLHLRWLVSCIYTINESLSTITNGQQ